MEFLMGALVAILVISRFAYGETKAEQAVDAAFERAGGVW